MSRSNWSRTPRSVVQAFGPHTPSLLAEARRRDTQRFEKVMQFLVCAFLAVAIIVLLAAVYG